MVGRARCLEGMRELRRGAARARQRAAVVGGFGSPFAVWDGARNSHGSGASSGQTRTLRPFAR